VATDKAGNTTTVAVDIPAPRAASGWVSTQDVGGAVALHVSAGPPPFVAQDEWWVGCQFGGSRAKLGIMRVLTQAGGHQHCQERGREYARCRVEEVCEEAWDVSSWWR